MDESTLKYYQKHAAELATRYEEADVSSLHARMLEHLPPQGTVLEIGCGSGRDASYLISSGFQVTAVDASLQMLAVAVREHPELKGRTFCAALPFEEHHPLLLRRFDAIISVALLMHVSDDDIREAGEQFRRLLEPGGILFISASERRPDVDGQRQQDGRIYVQRSPEQLEALLVQSGLRRKAIHRHADGEGRNINWYSIVLQRA